MLELNIFCFCFRFFIHMESDFLIFYCGLVGCVWPERTISIFCTSKFFTYNTILFIIKRLTFAFFSHVFPHQTYWLSILMCYFDISESISCIRFISVILHNWISGDSICLIVSQMFQSITCCHRYAFWYFLWQMKRWSERRKWVVRKNEIREVIKNNKWSSPNCVYVQEGVIGYKRVSLGHLVH